MTTSKTMHNALLALSRKAKKKTQVRKLSGSKNKKTAKIVELARTVFHSGRHHITRQPAVLDQTPVDRDRKSDKKPKQEEGEEVNPDKTLPPPIYDSYYAQQHEQLTQEMKQLQQQRNEIVEKQIEFWNVYKYGLEKISNLNDLRDAPDAIMPGNFPPPPPEVAEDSNADADAKQQEDIMKNNTADTKQEEISTTI